MIPDETDSAHPSQLCYGCVFASPLVSLLAFSVKTMYLYQSINDALADDLLRSNELDQIILPRIHNESKTPLRFQTIPQRRFYFITDPHKTWSSSEGVYCITCSTGQCKILHRSLIVVVFRGLPFLNLSIVELEIRCL